MKIIPSKLRKLWICVTIALPRELLRNLKLMKGHWLLGVKAADVQSQSSDDAEVEEQVRLGLEVMARRREIFRALARTD